jgi:hypothetical protein
MRSLAEQRICRNCSIPQDTRIMGRKVLAMMCYRGYDTLPNTRSTVRSPTQLYWFRIGRGRGEKHVILLQPERTGLNFTLVRKKYVKFEHKIKTAKWNEEHGAWGLTVQAPDGSEFLDHCEILVNGSGVLK